MFKSYIYGTGNTHHAIHVSTYMRNIPESKRDTKTHASLSLLPCHFHYYHKDASSSNREVNE